MSREGEPTFEVPECACLTEDWEECSILQGLPGARLCSCWCHSTEAGAGEGDPRAQQLGPSSQGTRRIAPAPADQEADPHDDAA